MKPKLIALVAIGFLFAAFVLQNAQVVEVRFLFWKAQASRVLVLLGTFALGLIVGWLSAWASNKKRKPSAS